MSSSLSQLHVMSVAQASIPEGDAKKNVERVCVGIISIGTGKEMEHPGLAVFLDPIESVRYGSSIGKTGYNVFSTGNG